MRLCSFCVCHFLFICRYFGDLSFSYYVNCRFQLLYVKILTFISSSIISFSPSSFLSSKLSATLFSDCASYIQGSLVFLTSQMMTFSSELLTRSLSLLSYVLDSGINSSCNSLLPSNAYFKTCFLNIQKILSTCSF